MLKILFNRTRTEKIRSINLFGRKSNVISLDKLILGLFVALARSTGFQIHFLHYIPLLHSSAIGVEAFVMIGVG